MNDSEGKKTYRRILDAALALVDAEAPRQATWLLLNAAQNFDSTWFLDSECVSIVSLGLRAALHPMLDSGITVAEYFRKKADEALFAVTEGPAVLMPLEQLEDLNAARMAASRKFKKIPSLDAISF